MVAVLIVCVLKMFFKVYFKSYILKFENRCASHLWWYYSSNGFADSNGFVTGVMFTNGWVNLSARGVM